MTPTAVLETALYITDLDAAQEFYGKVLGLPLISRVDGRHVFFRCGQGVVLLFNGEATVQPPLPGAKLPVPPHGATGQGHLCFATPGEEIDRWKAALQDNNIEIEADFLWPSGGRSIYFRDPSGNSLEFAEPRIWSL